MEFKIIYLNRTEKIIKADSWLDLLRLLSEDVVKIEKLINERSE